MQDSALTRRAMLVCGAAVSAAAFATPAFADSWCSNPDDNGMKACAAGMSLADETARQLKPHWCWAACIETVFATHGYNVTQEQIVQKIFGNLGDRPASGPEILHAINGRWTGARGTSFNAEGVVLWDRINRFERPDALARAIKELEGGNPLILATDRHTLVLTAMTYHEDAHGKITVDSLTVRDPWPDIPNRHALPADEITQSGFLCAVHVNAA